MVFGDFRPQESSESADQGVQSDRLDSRYALVRFAGLKRVVKWPENGFEGKKVEKVPTFGHVRRALERPFQKISIRKGGKISKLDRGESAGGGFQKDSTFSIYTRVL